MTQNFIKNTLKTIVSSENLNYCIKVYLECQAYLLPVFATYLITENIKTTLFVLVLIILGRFFLTFYYIKKNE